MSAKEQEFTGEQVSATENKFVVSITREACDACSRSNDFLDVLLSQTVDSHIVN
jgi:hypothetical protein